MKTFLSIVSSIVVLTLSVAQIKTPHIALSYSSQVMTYHPAPIAADAKELPFIMSKPTTGDQYGFTFKGFPTTTPFLELLDGAGKVVRTLTVNDLFGGKSTSAAKVLSSTVSGSMNRIETVYEVSLPQGKAMLTLSATATSLLSETVPAKLLLKIAVKNYNGGVASARMTMPYVGTMTSKDKGFTLTAARGGQTMAGTVLNETNALTTANRKLTIVSKPIVSGNETVLLLLSMDAFNAKTQADAYLQEIAANNPNDIVIINTVDKESAEPADTVTYRIHCINIGKGPVSDVVVTNPISAGTVFVDGSAAGEDTEITVERSEAPLPQVGAVQSVSWKFTKSIDVGSEKVVVFRVVIQ
jgi:uncharacterized repeat protein (TIGR01451 family)